MCALARVVRGGRAGDGTSSWQQSVGRRQGCAISSYLAFILTSLFLTSSQHGQKKMDIPLETCKSPQWLQAHGLPSFLSVGNSVRACLYLAWQEWLHTCPGKEHVLCACCRECYGFNGHLCPEILMGSSQQSFFPTEFPEGQMRAHTATVVAASHRAYCDWGPGEHGS